MDNKNKRNIVLLSLLAGTVAFVLIRRKINSNQAKALLDYVNAMPSQVDLSQNVDTGMSSTVSTKPDWNKLKIDNLKMKRDKSHFQIPIAIGIKRLI